MYKFQTVHNEKAKYRVGAKVTCDYYRGVAFKVAAKEWDLNGTVLYTIAVQGGCDNGETYRGLRQKYLNKA